MSDKNVANDKQALIAAFVSSMHQGKISYGGKNICDKDELKGYIIGCSPYAVQFWVKGCNKIAAYSICLSPLHSCPVIKHFGVDKRLMRSLYISDRGFYKFHKDNAFHHYIDYSFMFNRELGSDQKTMSKEISDMCKNCAVRIAPNWNR